MPELYNPGMQALETLQKRNAQRKSDFFKFENLKYQRSMIGANLHQQRLKAEKKQRSIAFANWVSPFLNQKKFSHVEMIKKMQAYRTDPNGNQSPKGKHGAPWEDMKNYIDVSSKMLNDQLSNLRSVAEMENATEVQIMEARNGIQRVLTEYYGKNEYDAWVNKEDLTFWIKQSELRANMNFFQTLVQGLKNGASLSVKFEDLFQDLRRRGIDPESPEGQAEVQKFTGPAVNQQIDLNNKTMDPKVQAMDASSHGKKFDPNRWSKQAVEDAFEQWAQIEEFLKLAGIDDDPDRIIGVKLTQGRHTETGENQFIGVNFFQDPKKFGSISANAKEYLLGKIPHLQIQSSKEAKSHFKSQDQQRASYGQDLVRLTTYRQRDSILLRNARQQLVNQGKPVDSYSLLQSKEEWQNTVDAMTKFVIGNPHHNGVLSKDENIVGTMEDFDNLSENFSSAYRRSARNVLALEISMYLLYMRDDVGRGFDLMKDEGAVFMAGTRYLGPLLTSFMEKNPEAEFRDFQKWLGSGDSMDNFIQKQLEADTPMTPTGVRSDGYQVDVPGAFSN